MFDTEYYLNLGNLPTPTPKAHAFTEYEVIDPNLVH